MRVLITGVNGFVGHQLARDLLDAGHSVVGLDNFFRSACDALISLARRPNFTFIEGDVTKPQDVKKALAGVDGIAHCSGLVGAPICSKYPELAAKVNFGGTENILDLRSVSQRLVYCSTDSVFGKFSGESNEKAKVNPLSEYAVTKYDAEKAVSVAKNSVSFRFATGMGVSPQFRVKLLVNDLCYQAVKNRVMVIFEKNARRSFIHVRDMSRAIQHGLFNENKSKVYCCGRDENNISKGELAQMIANKTGAYLHFAEIGSDPDGRDYAISHRLLEDEYGFRCNIGIEETVDELIKVIPVIKMVEQYV